MNDGPVLADVIGAIKAAVASNRALDADAQICLHRSAGRMSQRMKSDLHLQGLFYFETGPYDLDGEPSECGLASAADFTSTEQVREAALQALRVIPETSNE